MKIALLNDNHFGLRSESILMDKYIEKFFTEVFFPYIDKHNIQYVFDLGDTFDRRKYINFLILQNCKRYYFDELKKRNITLKMLVGNHTTFYKNNSDVSNINLVLGEYDNIEIFKNPQDIEIDGTKIALIPWINAENYNESLKYIKKTKAEIAFGHLEISGFQMDKGNICNTGFDRKTFDKFEVIYSGHFHHKSTDGHIFYLGAQYQMTWADFDDVRGFHVFDTNTRNLEFVPNPNIMFIKIVYDDVENLPERNTPFTFEYMNNDFDFTKYNNTYIKVVVNNKSNPYLFDTFLNKLQQANPIDINIIENNNMDSSMVENEINQTDDTITTLYKFVDGMNVEIANIDIEKLKSTLRELYNEASNMENS